MKIGIDIDGVLTNIEKWQLDYGTKFYSKYNKKIVNPKGYETYEIFDADEKLDDLFWNTYWIEYCTNVEVRKFASDVITKLKKDGYEINIITARGNWLPLDNSISKEESNNIVIEWLRKNNIVYDKIIFSPEDKLDICMKNNIDIMIEDKVDNINKISKEIPVICFNAGYNEKCEGYNIYRAYNWNDVYNIIKNNI